MQKYEKHLAQPTHVKQHNENYQILNDRRNLQTDNIQKQHARQLNNTKDHCNRKAQHLQKRNKSRRIACNHFNKINWTLRWRNANLKNKLMKSKHQACHGMNIWLRPKINTANSHINCDKPHKRQRKHPWTWHNSNRRGHAATKNWANSMRTNVPSVRLIISNNNASLPINCLQYFKNVTDISNVVWQK